MRKINFPRYENHFEEHNYFRGKIRDLQNELSLEEPDVTHVTVINNLVTEWLIVHIGKMDKEVASFKS